MFKNLRIGARLGLGFGIVVALLLGISLLAYLRVGGLNDAIEKLVNERFPKTVWANHIIEAINLIARAQRNLLIDPRPEESKLRTSMPAKRWETSRPS